VLLSRLFALCMVLHAVLDRNKRTRRTPHTTCTGTIDTRENERRETHAPRVNKDRSDGLTPPGGGGGIVAN